MHRYVRTLSFVIISSVSAGCAGIGNAPSTPFAPVSDAGRSIAASHRVAAKLVIRIPRRHHRRARFVSPSTKAIVITTQETAPIPGTPKTSYANLTVGSPGCTGTGVPYTCTVTLTGLTTGATYSLTFVTYDATQTAVTPHKGNVLSQNTVSKTIVAGVNNTIGVILDGVPKSFAVAPAPNTQPFGGSIAGGLYFGYLNPQAWTISTLDADANFIIGPGAPRVTASIDLGATGGIKIVASTTNPNRFTVSATGVGTGTLLLSAPVPGSSTKLSQGVAITAGTLATTIAGSLGARGSADGTGMQATFNAPQGISYNAVDGNLYIADAASCTIRELNPATLAVTTPVGSAGTCSYQNGTGSGAHFNEPFTVAADSSGNLYVGEVLSYAIRMVAPGDIVSKLTGGNEEGTMDGGPSVAQFDGPVFLAYDPDDNDLYVTDEDACTVRQVTLGGGAPGTVTTIAGVATACDGSNSDFSFPQGIVYAGNQTLYIVDEGNCEIRRIVNLDSAPSVDTVASPFAGNSAACGYVNGTGTGAEFEAPTSLVYDATHKNLYVVDYDTIRAISVPGAVVTTIAGTPGKVSIGDGWQEYMGSMRGLTYDPATSTIYATNLNTPAAVIREVQL